MSYVPQELRYTQTHEWIRVEEDGSVTIGITDYAQSQLGEMIFIDLPEVGVKVNAADETCVVESVKAASDVYSPLSGRIVAINEDLEDAPSLVNSDPFGDGWLFKLEPSDIEELDDLLDGEDYEQLLKENDE